MEYNAEKYITEAKAELGRVMLAAENAEKNLSKKTGGVSRSGRGVQILSNAVGLALCTLLIPAVKNLPVYYRFEDYLLPVLLAAAGTSFVFLLLLMIRVLRNDSSYNRIFNSLDRIGHIRNSIQNAQNALSADKPLGALHTGMDMEQAIAAATADTKAVEAGEKGTLNSFTWVMFYVSITCLGLLTAFLVSPYVFQLLYRTDLGYEACDIAAMVICLAGGILGPILFGRYFVYLKSRPLGALVLLCGPAGSAAGMIALALAAALILLAWLLIRWIFKGVGIVLRGIWSVIAAILSGLFQIAVVIFVLISSSNS